MQYNAMHKFVGVLDNPPVLKINWTTGLVTYIETRQTFSVLMAKKRILNLRVNKRSLFSYFLHIHYLRLTPQGVPNGEGFIPGNTFF